MPNDTPTRTQSFDVGEAIAMPWNLPGGRSFLARIMLWGTGLILMVYALFGRKFISAYADMLINASELEKAADSGDTQAALEMMSSVWGIMGSALIMGVFAWLVMISIETAMHKNAFRGTDHGAFPLRFGKDELRVLLAQLVIFAAIMVIYMAGIFLLIFMSAGTMVLAQGSSGLSAIVGILAVLGMIAYVVLLFRLMMGWAPAAALSVRDDKQRIFEGWTIAKGRNWPLFGSYLVVFLIGYIGIYAIMIIGGFLAFGNMDFLEIFLSTSDDPAALIEQMGEALQQPRVMVPLVIFTIIYAIATVLWYLHIWGVGTYMAKLDAKEKGLT